MSNEVQLEISKNTAAMQSMAEAIDKVATSTAKLSRQQGTLKTTGKESLDALRAMQVGISDFGSGLRGLQDSMKSMQTGLISAMREMGQTIVKGLKEDLDKTKVVAAESGKNAGEAYTKAIQSSIAVDARRQMRGEDAARAMLGLPSRAEMDTLAKSLAGQLTTSPLDARRQMRGEDAARAMLGLPSRAEMDTLAKSLAGQMAQASDTARVSAVDARRQMRGEDAARVMLGLPSRAEMDTLAKSLAGQMAQAASTAKAQAVSEAAQMESMFKLQEAAQKRRASEQADLAKVTKALNLENEKYQATLRAMAGAQYVTGGKAYSIEASPLDKLQNMARLSTANSIEAEAAIAAKAAEAKAKAHANLTTQANGSAKALADNAAGMKIWTGHANDAHSAARGLASGFGAMWLTWGNIIPLLAGAAVSHTIAGVVKQGAEVNHIMETMRVLTEQTTQETGKLNAQMLEMSRTGPLGPKEIAEGMKQLALAGLNAAQVGSAIKDVSTLSVAGELDMKKASEALTGIGEAFNIDARGYSYISDVLAKAAAESRSSVESIADAMKAASVIHKQYGVSLEDTALGVSLLNNLNIKGTAAGTALRNMYVDLSGRTNQSRLELERLGIKVKDVNGDFLGFAEVLKNIDAGLSKIGDPVARSRSLSLIASERGGKPLVEGLSLLNKPADNSDLYANKLAEIEDKFLNFQGFAAMSAAALVSTAQNQLKGVASTYQASLQEAFETAEPYIMSVSAKLRDLFQSEGFQTGLQNLMFTVGRVIEVFLEWGNVIALAVKGFALYKIAQVGVLVSTQAFTVAAASATSALYAKETATALATRSAVVHTGATNAQTLGLQAGTVAAYAANLGFNTLAVGIGIASAALRVFMAFAAPVVSIGAALYSAYLLFGEAKNTAFDEAKDAQHFNSLKSYNDYMEKNTERVLDNNEALRQNISLQDLQDKKAKDRLLAEVRGSAAALQKSRDTEQQRLDNAAAQAPEARKSYWQTSPLLKELDSKLQEVRDEENRQVANNVAASLASEETRRLLKNKQTKLPKEYGTLGGPIEGSPAVLAMHEAEHLSVLSQALDKQLATLHDHNAKVSAALADKHRNHLMTDSQFYVAKSIQDDKAYTEEQKAIQDRYRTEYEAVTAAQQRAISKLAHIDMTGKSDYDTQLMAMKFLQMNDSTFNARYPKSADRAVAKGALDELSSLDKYSKSVGYKRDEAAGKLESANTLKQEQANNALAGSYRNIEMSVESLDRQMAGHHAQIMGQQADSLVSHPFEQPWEKAGREQHKASLKKYSDDIARIQEDINKSRKQSADNLGAAFDSGNMGEFVKALEANIAAEEKLAQAQDKLNASKAQSSAYANKEADATKKTAFRNEINSFQKELATGVSGAISTAVFEGGAQGGEQLRKYLEQMFIRKPFEIAVQMSLEGLMQGEVGKSAVGGLFNWAKGGFGTLGGGASNYNFVNEAGLIDMGVGFASGGQANPFSVHPVNENGTELLSMGGKDYLMTGSQGATVTSVRDMPSGGSTIQHNVTINVDSRADQAQVHALVMGAVRQGNAQLVDQLQQAGALSR
jgi:TP901 family phage tail tape measure protein